MKQHCIVVFSASRAPDPAHRQMAADLGRGIAAQGWTLVNGGGPGLMDAVLQGARAVGGATRAVRLDKPGRVQSAAAGNFVTETDLLVRQQKLMSQATGFVALPGGLGSLFEVVQILALKNADQMSKPLVLLDRAFYQPLLNWLGQLEQQGYIDPSWQQFFKAANDVNQAIAHLRQA